MTTFALALVLTLLALLTVALQKTYFYVPHKELKRQAGRHDPLARTLFQAAAYGIELKLLLWFITGVSAAISFVLFARVAPPVLGFAAVALALWLAFVWIPHTRLTRLGAMLAVWCTPVLVFMLRLLHPVLEYVASYFGQHPVGPHTGLYEREDVYDLIEQQHHQSDNRINDRELELMRHALQFGEYKVRDCLIPSRRVRVVGTHEQLGPVLLDELHSSGHTHFPVYDEKPTNIVGILDLRTVSGSTKQHDAVRSHYNEHVAYVHEADSLAQAVRAFYDTKQRLFIVVNSFDEYVGILTLDDVLTLLVGVAEYAQPYHEDRGAVVARHHPASDLITPNKKLSESRSEVIE